MTDLKDKKIVYTFDTWEDFDDLMQYLEDEGVTWASGMKPTEWHWLRNRSGDVNQIAAHLIGGDLYYANKEWYQDSPSFIDYERVHWKKRKLKDRKIIYTFDTWEDYDDLMQHLEDQGITWVSGGKPIEEQWLKDMDYDASEIVIRLDKGILTYSNGWDLSFSSYRNYEKIRWKKEKKKDISLADFLGWEENTIYRLNRHFYKIKDGIIYKRSNIGDRWFSSVAGLNQYETFRKFEKYEPKYYAKIKGWELLSSDAYYFRWSKKWQILALGNAHAMTLDKDAIDYCMTKEEWKKHGVTEENADFFEEK